MKKINIVTGHYGSGKTNFSANLAIKLAENCGKVTVVDLDIVNPYFRSGSCSPIKISNLSLPCTQTQIWTFPLFRSIWSVSLPGTGALSLTLAETMRELSLSVGTQRLFRLFPMTLICFMW